MLVGYVALLNAAEMEEMFFSEVNRVTSKLAGVKDGLDILRKVQMRQRI